MAEVTFADLEESLEKLSLAVDKKNRDVSNYMRFLRGLTARLLKSSNLTLGEKELCKSYLGHAEEYLEGTNGR